MSSSRRRQKHAAESSCGAGLLGSPARRRGSGDGVDVVGADVAAADHADVQHAGGKGGPHSLDFTAADGLTDESRSVSLGRGYKP